MGKVYANPNLVDQAGNQVKYARVSRCILDFVTLKGEVYLSFYKDQDTRKEKTGNKDKYMPILEVRLGVDANEGLNPVTGAITCLSIQDFIEDENVNFNVAKVYEVLKTKKFQVNYHILNFNEGTDS